MLVCAMGLRETVEKDLQAAIKERDEVARDALRMLKSDILLREVELGRALEEGEELAVLQKNVKLRQDAIAQYVEGGRPEAADKERAEIRVIERYLPAALSEDELRTAICALAAELGATSKKDMGKLMKALGERYKGRYDGKTASRLVGEALA
jgi:uncharacterized protein YqeY